MCEQTIYIVERLCKAHNNIIPGTCDPNRRTLCPLRAAKKRHDKIYSIHDQDKENKIKREERKIKQIHVVCVVVPFWIVLAMRIVHA